MRFGALIVCALILSSCDQSSTSSQGKPQTSATITEVQKKIADFFSSLSSNTRTQNSEMHTDDPKKRIKDLLNPIFIQGAPRLVMKSSADIVQLIRTDNARGQTLFFNEQINCLYNESYTLESSFFDTSRSAANHEEGKNEIPPIDWLRWAVKHNFVQEISVPYFSEIYLRDSNGNIDEHRKGREAHSEFCHIFTQNNASATTWKIALTSAITVVQNANSFQFNTAEFGATPAYYVNFTLGLLPLYPDLVVSQTQFTGHARVIIRPDTQQAQLIDYEIDHERNPNFNPMIDRSKPYVDITYTP